VALNSLSALPLVGPLSSAKHRRCFGSHLRPALTQSADPATMAVKGQLSDHKPDGRGLCSNQDFRISRKIWP
jgi:hypothetical protein